MEYFHSFRFWVCEERSATTVADEPLYAGYMVIFYPVPGIPNVGGVPLAKPTEAEGRKKLMEKRWSQAEREGVEDNSSLLNKPKNILQVS